MTSDGWSCDDKNAIKASKPAGRFFPSMFCRNSNFQMTVIRPLTVLSFSGILCNHFKKFNHFFIKKTWHGTSCGVSIKVIKKICLQQTFSTLFCNNCNPWRHHNFHSLLMLLFTGNLCGNEGSKGTFSPLYRSNDRNYIRNWKVLLLNLHWNHVVLFPFELFCSFNCSI